MYQRIVGQKDRPYKLIVIDEAQMLSPLWLAGLSYMLADGGTFNLTGDLNQKPAVIDLPDWSGYEETIGDVEIRELNKCYRLTDEIASVALDVLFKHPLLYQFETVGRFGEKVQEIHGSESERLAAVAREVTKLLEQYKTIAIIGRTAAHCEILYQQLHNIFSETTLITENDDLAGKILVIPVSIIGGLEFDAVVIADYKQYDLADIYEAQQLYLGITRAVHKLILA